MISKAEQQARDTKVIQGLSTHFTGAQAFTFGGVEYKSKQIQSLLQNRIDSATATATARGKWLTASAAEQKVAAEADEVIAGLKTHLLNTYGENSEVVADFGFTPKQKQAASAQTMATAVAKREATRLARGTVGKRAKLKIKGALPPDPSAAPAADPATPSAAPVVAAAAPKPVATS